MVLYRACTRYQSVAHIERLSHSLNWRYTFVTYDSLLGTVFSIREKLFQGTRSYCRFFQRKVILRQIKLVTLQGLKQPDKCDVCYVGLIRCHQENHILGVL
jgi:hypothetical protein